jgi:CHAT domain-containing protein
VQEALLASERARARTLLELIEKLDLPVGAGIPEALRARLRALREEVRDLEAEQRRARAEAAPAEDIEALEAQIIARMAEYAKLRRRVEAADPRRAALLSAPPVDLASARDLLEPDTLAVELYLGAGGAYAIAIGTSTATVRSLGPQGPLDAAARKLHADLSARNRREAGEDAAERAARIAAADDAAQAGLRALRRRLFGALEPLLAGRRRVVIVPDGALHYVPFAALLPEHEVVTAPSLGVLAALRARAREARGEGLALIGDPVLGASDPRLEVRGAETSDLRLPRLTFAGAELDAIAELVPASERVVRRGFEATRAWVLDGGLASRRLVHFATHGVLDAEEPARSGLVLSEVDAAGRPLEGFLNLADVYGLRLSADVVTLSACETALGKEVRGEGLVGLTRGLLHAGARQVVASLWKVHDQATRELMVRFYRGLLERGRAPAAALRAAQRALANSERFSAPYYWAGFVLQGDGR